MGNQLIVLELNTQVASCWLIAVAQLEASVPCSLVSVGFAVPLI